MKKSKWRFLPNVSHRGAKPSVCYEIFEAGPRGGAIQTIARTPRRHGQTEDPESREQARLMAATPRMREALIAIYQGYLDGCDYDEMVNVILDKIEPLVKELEDA